MPAGFQVAGNQLLDGNWTYNDGSQISNGWNAQLTGNNPCTASDLGWNGTIQSGQLIEFGFQGTKGSDTASIPAVSGSVCN